MATVFDWAQAHTEGLRMEQDNRHSLTTGRWCPDCGQEIKWVGGCSNCYRREEPVCSAHARHQRAIRYCEQIIYPSVEVAADHLALAMTGTDQDELVSALRRLDSVGTLARHALDQLEA